MVPLAVFHKLSSEGVSLLDPVGLGCWALLALRLGLIATILASPASCWAKWREAVFCTARAIDSAILVHNHSCGLLLASETVQDRWTAWLNFFVFQGGHWMNCLALSLIYRVRFTNGLYLLAAHVGAALGTMKWAVLDPAAQHFSDYLERGSAWCLGIDGLRCLAAATWLRLLLIGFMLPLYILYRQEVRERTQFLQDAHPHGHGGIKRRFAEWWCLLFVYVVLIGTLVGQGRPVGVVLGDLF
jgi:hypothetical protein